jgi:hypothetical protein
MRDFNAVRHLDNVFVWHEGQLIFMCIGKAANSSIKAAVLDTMGGVDPKISVHFDERIQYVPKTHVHKYEYPIITIVRDPFDRLLSFWKDKIAHRDQCSFEHLGLHPGMSFEETASAVCALDFSVHDTHLSRQMDLLSHQECFLPDYVFKYEKIKDEWKYVQEIAACYLPDLPHYNKSNPVPWSCATGVLNDIMIHYDVDFHRLGYLLCK